MTAKDMGSIGMTNSTNFHTINGTIGGMAGTVGVAEIYTPI